MFLCFCVSVFLYFCISILVYLCISVFVCDVWHYVWRDVLCVSVFLCFCVLVILSFHVMCGEMCGIMNSVFWFFCVLCGISQCNAWRDVFLWGCALVVPHWQQHCQQHPHQYRLCHRLPLHSRQQQRQQHSGSDPHI